MRDIKYRVYIKNIKQMEDVERINFDIKTVETHLFANGDYWEHDFDEVELMQYTGLKDKNDKEIYEGDVLINFTSIEQPGYTLTHKIVGDIQIKMGMTYLIGKQWQYIERDVSDVTIGEYKAILLSPTLFEVIGNIHENPELIK